MAVNYYTQDQAWEQDYYDYGEMWDAPRRGVPVDVVLLLLVAAVATLLVLGLWFVVDLGPAAADDTAVAPPSAAAAPNTVAPQAAPQTAPVSPVVTASTFVAPYDSYSITQGLHGMSYGHAAIDIAAGKGAPVKSPIAGSVTELFVDGIGNPVLVIENERYQVTMLHGDYTVGVGDVLQPGDFVGTEGNNGNTYDMQGRSCRNRDCGYHTHLNVFDKQLGRNVNPLDLIEQ